MWSSLRILALTFLLVVGALVTGRGGWLLQVLDTWSETVGATTMPRAPLNLSPLATIGSLAAGGAAAVVRPAHRAVGQLVTLLHEVGHTVVAAALGARPRGIVLRHDASGHATASWVGQASPLRRLALGSVAFVGLPAAAAASAAAAQLLVVVGPRTVLWSVAGAGALVALLARSVWSLLIAAGTAGIAVAALGDTAEPWAAGAVVALVTAVAVKTTGDNLRRLRTPIREGDDARVVGADLGLPARLVQFVQVATGATLSGFTLWWIARHAHMGW